MSVLFFLFSGLVWSKQTKRLLRRMNGWLLLAHVQGRPHTQTHRHTERRTMSLPEILPLEVIDKTINQRVLIVLQSNREFEGTLVGFDDFVNVILEDAVEWLIDPEDETNNKKVMQHHGRMLLSGNNIAILVPGGKKTPAHAL